MSTIKPTADSHPPRAADVVLRYALVLGVPAIGYAVYLAVDTIRRTDNRALADTASGWAATLAWALATTVPLFAALGALSVAILLAVLRGWRWRGRFRVASIAQGGFLAVVAAWAYVNQAVDYYTGEALTYGTIHFVWENAAEVFQCTWHLARWKLGGFGVGAAVALVVFPVLVHRLNRSWYAVAANAPRPAVLRSSRRLVLAGVVGVMLVGSFAVQLAGAPSEALVELSRTSPPLRFFDLTRFLVENDLRIDIPDARGPALLSDEQYAATMVREPRPARNVMVLFLESVPASALGCYGYHRDVSPNIDRLAAAGAVFENATAAASFSAYGQVSIFTSLYMLRHQTNDHFAWRGFPFRCLHDVLKLRGYELAGFASGNESFENINRFYNVPSFDVWFSHDTAPDLPKFDANRMDDKYATERCIDWIESRDQSRPFFCYVNLQSTHFDYFVPPPWDGHYKPTLPWLSSGNGLLKIPPEQLVPVRNQFDNALRYLDHFVGRIRTALEDSGQLDDTIWVLVGDHGEAFMEHGIARHGTHLWQEMIHIPLIIHAPGLVEPQRSPAPASHIDINPTVTGLLGLRAHPAWQGVDILADGYDGRSRPIFSILQLTRMQEAVLLDGWKYTFDFTDCREYLFNLTDDAGERNNLARTEPDRRAAMRAVLSTFHSHQLRYYADPDRYGRHYIGPAPFPEVNLDADVRPEP